MKGFRFPSIEKRGLLLVGSALSGLIAAFLINHHVKQKVGELEARSRVPAVSRIVAATPLKAGQVMELSHLALRDIPEDWLPSRSVREEELPEVIGRELQVDLAAGEALSWSGLRRPLEALADRIGLGRRAVTIPVDDISSVSGLLKPDDLIDVYVSFDHQGQRVTQSLVQRMRVLATGQQLDIEQPAWRVGRNFSTVTLDSSPEEALKLITARESGVITAMLRPQQDKEAVDHGKAGGLASLLGLNEPPPLLPERKWVPVIYGDQLAVADSIGNEEDGDVERR